MSKDSEQWCVLNHRVEVGDERFEAGQRFRVAWQCKACKSHLDGDDEAGDWTSARLLHNVPVGEIPFVRSDVKPNLFRLSEEYPLLGGQTNIIRVDPIGHSHNLAVLDITRTTSGFASATLFFSPLSSPWNVKTRSYEGERNKEGPRRVASRAVCESKPEKRQSYSQLAANGRPNRTHWALQHPYDR